MENRKNGGKTGRTRGGTFARGNPGKPKGARHRITRAVEELLDGEAEGLTRKAVEMALAGDTTALRLCMERICPARKDAPVKFALPRVESAADASKALSAVLAAVAAGDITPGEASGVASLIDSFRRVLEVEDLERRVSALEDQR